MGLDMDFLYTDGEPVTNEMTDTEEGYCHYHLANLIQYYRKFWDLNMFFINKFKGRNINSEYIELDYTMLMELKKHFRGHERYGEINDLVRRCLEKINKGKRIFYYPNW